LILFALLDTESRSLLPPAHVSRSGRASTLDGLCDPQGGLGGREVRGVDDLGLAMSPRAGCFGVGLEVFEAERGGDGVFSLDPPAQGDLVSVQDELPYRDGRWARPC
jgi:hypothetical protein